MTGHPDFTERRRHQLRLALRFQGPNLAKLFIQKSISPGAISTSN